MKVWIVPFAFTNWHELRSVTTAGNRVVPVPEEFPVIILLPFLLLQKPMVRPPPGAATCTFSWHPAHLCTLGRPATAEEVARVAAFLISPDAAYITGASLLVDGGLVRGE